MEIAQDSEDVLTSSVGPGELLYGFRQSQRFDQSLAGPRSFLESPHVSFVPDGLVTEGSRSMSPGRWDPRRSRELLHWRSATGSAARVTDTRPSCTADWRRSRRIWRLNRLWAGVFLVAVWVVDASENSVTVDHVGTAA